VSNIGFGTATPLAKFHMTKTQNNFDVFYIENGTNPIMIKDNGNVGIGTTDPTVRLAVVYRRK